ncbi:alpha/beta hydrolase [Paenibacillus rhizovicinus]|uniref:prolyl aminopeptidase n=1 Tax=Paenibacillus rhizovicinus TaxID=2704463 RepID=A0A6C0P807_9BACL|nr:alpha/beta hydrolase [Paenibacillus rhizovicinus]QHW34717.1 alpha/beta hydrolase [Paenibacillus rhizovicinus]
MSLSSEGGSALGQLIALRHTNLYIEEFGRSNEEVLLYLHGGPGASCIDFTCRQAIALSGALHVIAIDQRGVCRSDRLREEETFGIADIIADCEEIRTRLGFERWSVLGHSFGGYVAMKYALQHRGSVKSVLYEAPTFDIGRSMNAIINGALQVFERDHEPEHAEHCRQLLNRNASARELWQSVGKLWRLLGPRKDELYFHGIEPSDYSMIMEQSGEMQNERTDASVHARKLEEEGVMFESLLPLMLLVDQPSLLLAGMILFAARPMGLSFCRKGGRGSASAYTMIRQRTLSIIRMRAILRMMKRTEKR